MVGVRLENDDIVWLIGHFTDLLALRVRPETSRRIAEFSEHEAD
jgi:hypothetical protein